MKLTGCFDFLLAVPAGVYFVVQFQQPAVSPCLHFSLEFGFALNCFGIIVAYLLRSGCCLDVILFLNLVFETVHVFIMLVELALETTQNTYCIFPKACPTTSCEKLSTHNELLVDNLAH